MATPIGSPFEAAVRRGRWFERVERARWQKLKSGFLAFEASTVYNGRRGRIDIRVDEQTEYVSVIELKSTRWDHIASHRIRPTALRHANQVWRYINGDLGSDRDVCAGVVYSRAPRNYAVRELVEKILNDVLIQVVWRQGAYRERSPTSGCTRRPPHQEPASGRG